MFVGDEVSLTDELFGTEQGTDVFRLERGAGLEYGHDGGSSGRVLAMIQGQWSRRNGRDQVAIRICSSTTLTVNALNLGLFSHNDLEASIWSQRHHQHPTWYEQVSCKQYIAPKLRSRRPSSWRVWEVLARWAASCSTRVTMPISTYLRDQSGRRTLYRSSSA